LLFIGNLGTDVEATAIVASIVHLGQALGLQIVAEGVETHEQRVQLNLLGCQLAQGYYWSRPVAAGQLESWLKAILPPTAALPDEKPKGANALSPPNA
jgi:EAL domain-containing protein (putative c-di-GMP-specific phosphodiesterase class I)